MESDKGLALLIPGIIFFVTFALVNSFTDGVIKLIFLLLPTVVVLTGVTMICYGDKKPDV